MKKLFFILSCLYFLSACASTPESNVENSAQADVEGLRWGASLEEVEKLYPGWEEAPRLAKASFIKEEMQNSNCRAFWQDGIPAVMFLFLDNKLCQFLVSYTTFEDSKKLTRSDQMQILADMTIKYGDFGDGIPKTFRYDNGDERNTTYYEKIYGGRSSIAIFFSNYELENIRCYEADVFYVDVRYLDKFYIGFDD